MITVNQPRENGRTTFCRQFTYNPKGEYNSRRDGAIVSGMPVAGQPASALPVGTKIALTDPAKLSPNEVGYIVVQQDPDRVMLIPDAHQKRGTWSDQESVAQQFIADMESKAQEICSVVAVNMTIGQLGTTSAGTIDYFSDVVGYQANAKRAFWSNYWTATKASAVVPATYYFCYSDGRVSTRASSASSTSTLAFRPLLSIPSSTLVSSQPNAAGAYELV